MPPNDHMDFEIRFLLFDFVKLIETLLDYAEKGQLKLLRVDFFCYGQYEKYLKKSSFLRILPIKAMWSKNFKKTDRGLCRAVTDQIFN